MKANTYPSIGILAVFYLLFCTTLIHAQSSSTPADVPDLAEVFLSPAASSISASEAQNTFSKYGFHWQSSDQSSAQIRHRSLHFDQHSVYDATLWFQQDRLQSLNISLYNRGDAGDLSEDAFFSKVNSIQTTLSQHLKNEPVEAERDPKSLVRMQSLIWTFPDAQVLLESSFTRENKSRRTPFRAEFIRLRITFSSEQTQQPQSISSTTSTSPSSILSAPDVSDTGEVLLGNIPMVDQGQKGYCVVASTERILLYYGKSADQHELAQLANTATEGGTSRDEMLSALKDISNKLRIRVKSYYEFNFDDLRKTIYDYNRLARRNRHDLIDLNRAASYQEIYDQLIPDIFLETRESQRSDFRRFSSDIQKEISEGIPLLWTVQLGLFSESPAINNPGAHMRLIIGYNKENSEIIYSDSWGPGHEKKYMPLNKAWAITTALYTIEPK